jgi:hypothetical protein
MSIPWWNSLNTGYEKRNQHLADLGSSTLSLWFVSSFDDDVPLFEFSRSSSKRACRWTVNKCTVCTVWNRDLLMGIAQRLAVQSFP